MKVLSLFDGISCGHVALDRAGIPVDVYYASEIDKYAIQITQKNYPNTIQLGDVTKIDFTQFIGKIDLIMGGSPCQDLSIAGKRKGLQGERSGLFYKFVEAIEVIKPKYFLLENNVGMPKEAYEEMSRLMGCYPIEINSALVSAQTRKRYYWTNIGPAQYNLFGFPTVDIPQPENKGILLKDVLESGYAPDDKSRCIQSSIGRTTEREYFKKNQGQMVAEPICVNIPETVTVRKYEVNTENLKNILREHKIFTNKEIAEKLNQPITKVEHWFRTDNSFAIPDAGIWLELKVLLNIQTDEFDKSIMEFETKEGSYDKATRKYSVNGKMSTLMAAGNDEILEPLRLGQIGKGGQGQRIYSVRGKSVSLSANGGGQGAKTGLYKIDLPDGEYLIRKLTPLECERLQTLPDNYTEGVSNTQRYKAIGNGWTVDVIAHIFSFLNT
jgi:DNA (cytosine-5)-methyltransferase 3A